MYRIHFDPMVSMFVVQFLVWGLFWKTCHDENGVVRFSTYPHAAKWVSDKGIPEIYEVQAPKKMLYSRPQAA